MHNPRKDHVGRVFSALQALRTPRSLWEFVVVDNASQSPLREWLDLDWHPRSRVVREEKLGLTQARLRGLSETSGEVLVYVDDDNVLQPDYLDAALEVARERPTVGAWGGNVCLEFEVTPPDWTEPHWELLAMKKVETEATTRDVDYWPATPVGAGLCVRRNVMLHYRDQLARSMWRRSMDRRGRNLMSAGDQDIASTACDLGMEKGVFPRLRLNHLIPPERWEEPYLLRLETAAEFSNHALKWCRDPEFPAPVLTPRRFFRYLRNYVRLTGRDRRFHLARVRGERAAVKFHESLVRDSAKAAMGLVQAPHFLNAREEAVSG